MAKATPDYPGILGAAKRIAQEEAAAAVSTIDQLLTEAQHLVPPGYHPYADIQANDYGFHVVIWDEQPYQIEGPEGFGVNHNPGQIITAGSGRTLDEAVTAANRGMKPRS